MRRVAKMAVLPLPRPTVMPDSTKPAANSPARFLSDSMFMAALYDMENVFSPQSALFQPPPPNPLPSVSVYATYSNGEGASAFELVLVHRLNDSRRSSGMEGRCNGRRNRL